MSPMQYGAVSTDVESLGESGGVEIESFALRGRKRAACLLFGVAALVLVAVTASGRPSLRSYTADAADLVADANDTKVKNEDRVEFCLQQSCNGQTAALAKQYSDPGAKFLMKCLEDAQANATEALDCFPASGDVTPEKVKLLECGGCKDCLPVEINETTCAEIPSGWGSYAGGYGGAGGAGGAGGGAAGGYSDYSKYYGGGGAAPAPAPDANDSAAEPAAPAMGGFDYSKYMGGGWGAAAPAPAALEVMVTAGPTAAPIVTPYMCFEDNCSKQVAGLGMAWNDPVARALMSCLQAAVDTAEFTACMTDATGNPAASPAVFEASDCSGCQSCADIEVDADVCAKVPTWTSGGATGAFDWSKFAGGYGGGAPGPSPAKSPTPAMPGWSNWIK